MGYRPIFHTRLGQQYDWPQAPIPGIIPEEWGLQPIDGEPANGGAPAPAPAPGGGGPGTVGPAPWIYQPTQPAPAGAPAGGGVGIPAGYMMGPDGRFVRIDTASLLVEPVEEEETGTALKIANWGLLALLLVGVTIAATS